ncbi:MAG: hypothetical protein AB7U59_13270 [Desulfovibrionaceae bacterium]|jgi:hypothetical protein
MDGGAPGPLGVTAATLTPGRDTFLEAGETGLKPHPVKDSVELDRLREKRGAQAMENELLRGKLPEWSKNHPLTLRRSRK